MFNLDTVTTKNDNENWPYRMLIIGPSGSGKTNALLNLIQKNNNNLIDKIYLYAKDLEEPNYQLLIGKRENAETKNLNDTNTFFKYSNTIEENYNKLLLIIQQILIPKTFKDLQKLYQRTLLFFDY